MTFDNSFLLSVKKPQLMNEVQNLIEKRNIIRKNSLNLNTRNKKIFIVLEGCINVTIEAEHIFTVKDKRMFFVECGQRLILTANVDSTVVILKLHDFSGLHNFFPLEKLSSIKDIHTAGRSSMILEMRKIISYNVNTICLYLEYGLKDHRFLHLKIKEFLFFLSKEYTISELYIFFSDTTSIDVRFSDEIKKNAYKYYRMAELAKAMHYTTSGFEKRFKKVFNTSPYQWMKEMKARRLYYDLKMTDKGFKELADEFGFKSNNYFIQFCIANLGASPASIRKSREEKDSD